MRIEYHTPGGEIPRLFSDMLSQTHLLIAGSTGSGKSCLVNGLMYTALYHSPVKAQFILIDPKGTELEEYRELPHVIQYASAIDDCITALQSTLNLVHNRFTDMRKRKIKTFDGSDVYVVIDELMYLLNRPKYKRVAIDLLQDILVIARAARVHVIACTQSPTSQTGLPVNLRCNFDSRVGLRTSTAQDSRNIIGCKGCEQFPKPAVSGIAFGYYMRDGEMDICKLPYIPDPERDRIVVHWLAGKGRKRFKLFGRA